MALPASSTNSRSGLDQSRPLPPFKFATSGDTTQNQPQVSNGLNRAVKCRESVLECRETVTSPEQITYGLGTRECHKFRAELFSTMPSLAYDAAHKYVKISKQASYVQANLFLSNLSKELQIADLNLSKDARELKLFAKQKANQCLRNTAHLKTEQAYDYCLSKFEKYGFSIPCDMTHVEALTLFRTEKFWFNKLKTLATQKMESIRRQLGLVNQSKSAYCSDERLRQHQWEKAQADEYTKTRDSCSIEYCSRV